MDEEADAPRPGCAEEHLGEALRALRGAGVCDAERGAPPELYDPTLQRVGLGLVVAAMNPEDGERETQRVQTPRITAHSPPDDIGR